MAALFGLDMAVADTPAPPPEKPAPRKKRATTTKPDLELTEDGYVKWWK